MEITRKDIIRLCDQFLNDKITKVEIKNFASTLMFSDELDWDDEDEMLSNTIFEWDNEAENFPITKVNMALWKSRLKNNIDSLQDYNVWDSHLEKQKEICTKYNSTWNPIDKHLLLRASVDLTLEPLNGMRYEHDNGTTGWFIWSGEFSEAADFFEPISAEQVLQIRPQMIPYFGLDVGFRFLIDNENYEKVWFDETLKG